MSEFTMDELLAARRTPVQAAREALRRAERDARVLGLAQRWLEQAYTALACGDAASAQTLTARAQRLSASVGA